MFKIKRWLWLANDLTNAMLGQSQEKSKRLIKSLKTWLFVFVLLFLISLFFNLYNYIIVE
ncbi:MAG: hypothetical protein V1765_01760 [bacterium]